MNRASALALLLLAASAAGQSHVRTRVPGKEDTCLFWPERKYVYNVDAAGSSKTPGTSELTAIDAAFQSWISLSSTCSDYAFSKGPPAASRNVEYRQGASDNQSIVLFRERNCIDVAPDTDPCWTDGNGTCGNKYDCWDNGDATIALTTATYSVRSGVIYDADIELNAAPHESGSSFLFTTVNSPPCQESGIAPTCVATDLQNTMTHEIGHVIGLDHSPVEGSTMEATAPIGETKKRVIDSGTANGFCTIYPRSGPTPGCDATGSSVRRIVAESRGTALEAVSVGCSIGVEGLLLPLGLLMLRRRRAYTHHHD